MLDDGGLRSKAAPTALRGRLTLPRAPLAFALLASFALAACNSSGARTGTSAPVAALPAATAATGAPLALAAPAPLAGPYLIGPQDVLEITVFEVAELNRTVQVSGTGTVNFPLIGDVPAMGRSARELEADIAKRLDNGFVRSPNVSVNVKEFNSQRVTVDGAVRKPGVFPVRDRVTLTQAVALAGGQDTEIAGSGVIVMRMGPQGQTTLRFDLNRIRQGAEADPVLMNGDSIIVETSNGKAVLNVIGKIAPVGGLAGLVP